MAVSLLINTILGDTLIEVVSYCNKIDKIKLRAGFPFGDFEVPTFNYTVLKSKLDQFYVNKDEFITTVSGRGLGKSEFKSKVENKNVIGEDFYTIKNTLNITNLDFEQVYTLDDETVSYINIYDLLAGIGITLPETEFIDFYRSPYVLFGSATNDERSRNRVEWGNLHIKREGGYVRDYEMIKKILASARWFISNSTPRVATYNTSGINLTQIILGDPYLWDIESPFILDRSLIKKQSEETSLAGFKMSRDKVDEDEVDLREHNLYQNALGFYVYSNNKKESVTLDPEGTGKNYNINLTSPPEDLYIRGTDNEYYNLLSEYGAFLEARRISSYYRTKIRNRKMMIETFQDTTITPYRAVVLDKRKYYCVEAQLDIRNDGINKYILQERLI